MNTSSANIGTESGTIIRTARGRRRPVYRESPFAICPVCRSLEHRDALAAGRCFGCESAARAAARKASEER